MQCFRCGAFLPGDFSCPTCGRQRLMGEDVCSACGTPNLCAACSGASEGPTASLLPTDPQSASALQYEYLTLQIPMYIGQDDYESYDHFNQRFSTELVQKIGDSALEGWQTIDALDYNVLKRQGMIHYNLMSLFGKKVVTVRLKRLVGGPSA